MLKIHNSLRRVVAICFSSILLVNSMAFVAPPNNAGNMDVGVNYTPISRNTTAMWDVSWGTRLLGNCKNDSPILTLSDDAIGQEMTSARLVLEATDVPDPLRGILTVHEISRVALTSKTQSYEFTNDPPTTGVFINVNNDVVGFRCTDSQSKEYFIWGILTHAVYTVIQFGNEDPNEQNFNVFTIYGKTETAEAAEIAVNSASKTIAVALAGSTPGCFDNCMAPKLLRLSSELSACMEDVGIATGAGALLCLGACIFGGPTYPACVLSCWGIDGTVGTAALGLCVGNYIVKRTAASIACRIDCGCCFCP